MASRVLGLNCIQPSSNAGGPSFATHVRRFLGTMWIVAETARAIAIDVGSAFDTSKGYSNDHSCGGKWMSFVQKV